MPSGSASSSYVSQADDCLGCAVLPPDLLAVAETLEERVGSESDRSESQSLSPATESQPSTDTSTGPDPELSESDSLDQENRDKCRSVTFKISNTENVCVRFPL